MKKVLLFSAAVLFVASSLTSCKKTYHCECSLFGTTVKGASVKLKKSDAKTYKASCTSSGLCTWVTE